MKVSTNWLKDYINLDGYTNEELFNQILKIKDKITVR